MIYDCFTFWNEFDLLEIRLNELKDVVDQFIICESNVTHAGNPKPLWLSERIDQFKDFNIKLLVYEGSNNPSSAWDNEKAQRNYLKNGLNECFADDVIIVSDVDEVPNAESVAMLPYIQGASCLEMSLAIYFLNNLDEKMRWVHAKAVKYGQLNHSLDDVRLGGFVNTIKNAGHHMSYLGGIKAVDFKVRNFAHQEYNNDLVLGRIEEAIASNRFYSNLDVKLTPTDPHKIKSMPKYILNNLEKYKKHLIEF